MQSLKGRFETYLVLVVTLLLGLYTDGITEVICIDDTTLLPGEPWESHSVYFGTDISVMKSNKPVKVRFKRRNPSAPRMNLFFVEPETDTLQLLFESPGDRGASYVIDVAGNKQTEYEIELKKYTSGTTITFMVQNIDTLEWTLFTEIGEVYPHFLKKFYTGQNRKGIDPYISECVYSRDFPAMYYKRVEMGVVNDSVVEIGFCGEDDFVFAQLMIYVENVELEGVTKHKLPPPRSIVIDSSGNLYTLELICPAVPDTIQAFTAPPYPDTITFPVINEQIKMFYTLDGTNPYESGTKKEYTGTITVDGPVTIKAYAQYSDDSLWLPSRLYTDQYGDVTSGTRNNIVFRQKSRIHDFNSIQSFRIDGRSLGRIATNRLGKGGKRLPSGIVIYREPGTRSCYPALISR